MLPPLPTLSFTPTLTQYSASFHSQIWTQHWVMQKNCFAHSLVCVPAECLYPLYIRQEQRAEKGRREDVVQYSLVDVAGHYAELQGVLIYYRGQWSMKSWRWAERGANPFSPSPMPPTSPLTAQPSPPPCFSQPISALPSPGRAFLGPWPPACDWRGCPAAEDQL